MRGAFLALLIATIGCASSTQRPATVAEPAIAITPPVSVFFGSGNTAGVDVVVDVTNRATVPLTVREIELSSPGMVQYTLQMVRQAFKDSIPPGETRKFTVFTEAISQVAEPNEPLRLRIIVTFEAAGVTFREIVER